MTAETKDPQNILILGDYGLIGSGIARHLIDAGHHVTGLDRNRLHGVVICPTA